MRSGFLGRLTSGAQPPAQTDDGLPPEKKMAIEALPTRIMAGKERLKDTN